MKFSMSFEGGKALERYLKDLDEKTGQKNELRAGFLETATYPDGKKVAQVAFWNEFGTSKAPARPFFRQTINKHSPHWGLDLGKFLVKVGYWKNQALSLLGTEIKDEIVQSIVDWPADNAPSTVAKKGFNKGLIDSGVMQRSVDFEVSDVA